MENIKSDHCAPSDEIISREILSGYRKLFGYEGYKALENKGYELSQKENTIVSDLKNFRGSVRTCSGCIFLSEGFLEIINELNGRLIDIAPKKERENNETKKNQAVALLNKLNRPVLFAGMGSKFHFRI